jgi:hypothetical protein
MDGNRPSRRLVVRLGVCALLTLSAASPVAAQSAVDTAAAVGFLVTPAGALPTPVSGVVAGSTAPGIAFSALFGYQHDRPGEGLFTTTGGGRLDVRLPWLPLNVSATAGRRLASCPPQPRNPSESFLEVECNDVWMAGAGATLRLIRASVGDGFGWGSSSCLTVSLDGTAGIADEDTKQIRSDWKNAAARSATAGLTLALATQTDGATFVPFITPTVGWAHVISRRIAPRVNGGVVTGADTIAFDQSGERLAVTGGLAILGTRQGVGFNITAQGMGVSGFHASVGAAVTLGTPWGRRNRPRGESGFWGTGMEGRSSCQELSGL